MKQPSAATAEARDIRAIDSFMLYEGLLRLRRLGAAVAGDQCRRQVRPAAGIAMAGHTDDASLHEVVIGNNVIAIAANAIRFERARRDGIASRLDVYLHWPDLEGYSEAHRNDFNHTGGTRRIVFLSFEERVVCPGI